MSRETTPDGIAPRAFEAWFLAQRADVMPPLSYERIAGGRSNLTFIVGDAEGRRFVLRRPPLHSRLPSAHDMGREHRIQSALAGTSVPVPQMLCYCADESVIGADFYVMSAIDGLVVADQVAATKVPEKVRRTASLDLIDTLVRLHRIEPDSVGLGDLGKTDGYISRQLKRWSQQWNAQKTREVEAMEKAHAALAAQVPDQTETRIVHGDYRLDNVVLSPQGEVRAVLDWELCTLGDPLADLGMLVAYWAQPGDRVVALPDAPTLEGGFASRRELIDRYCAGTGASPIVDYYVAFACWKIAAILEGVHARMLAGAYGDTQQDAVHYRYVVEALAEEACRLIV